MLTRSVRPALLAALVAVLAWPANAPALVTDTYITARPSPVASIATNASSVTCSVASGRVAVGVVVDFGDGAAPAIRCGDVANTANGFDALRSAGFAPRVESGFLCGIDGIPASGCATGAGFDGSYWRYFRVDSSGRWRYASVGAGTRLERHDGCATEGWVWSGRPDVSPPTVSPGQIGCAHLTATTRPDVTTTTVHAAPTTIRPSQSGAGGTSSNGTSSGGGAVTGGGSDHRVSTDPGAKFSTKAPSPADDDEISAGSGVGTDDVGTPDDETDPGVDVDGGPDATADGSSAGSGVMTNDVGDASRVAGSTGDESASGMDLTRSATDSTAGSPLGTIVGLVAVVVIIGGAVIVGRRRSAESRNHP